MKKHIMLFAGAALLAALPSFAEDAPKPPQTPSEVVAAAKPDEWKTIDPKDLLVMDLAPDAKGKARRVIIQLMPPPFSQGWVGNIRKLASAHWWDGTAIVRVQDNYVTQWGDPNGDDPKLAKKLPDGLVTVPESEYTQKAPSKKSRLASRFTVIDSYADMVEFERGWPIAQTGDRWWPLHCYGAVGVGRNLSPDTGTGAELYTVIGHAPRQLDRNIAIVGRVIEGMENLSSLPRGTGQLGFYETPDERSPILSIRLMSEMPTDKPLPQYEYLSTDSQSFVAYADKRANRKDDFYNVPAGGVDICNAPVPVRRKAQ